MLDLTLACQLGMRYISLVEQKESERQRKDPERADPITRLIASRVREIRQQQRLSGAALGAAVRDLGLQGWVDSTVGKLETSRRESVTVRELLALAVALGVPPLWLLADPQAGTPVPIAEGIEADPWTALMWLTGNQPLAGPDGEGRHATAYLALFHLTTLARLLAQYHQFRKMLDLPMVSAPEGDVVVAEPGVITTFGDPTEMRRTTEAAEASTLRAIADRLGQFRALGLSVPPLPPEVCKRAVELGIDLPGQEGFTP
jgi:transcriptional regulator with XRE-family HTH domain